VDPLSDPALRRHAHTLKGSAGMVGLPQVGAIAQALEGLFAEVEGGRRPVTEGFADAVLAAIADLRYIVSGLLHGLDVGARSSDTEQSLRELAAAPAAAPANGMSQDDVYQLTCGHLGVPCDGGHQGHHKRSARLTRHRRHR
jgi:chemotaxis protein histidine kinase CheA